MIKILITGFSGFVSRHFLEFLFQNNIQCEIYGIDIQSPIFDYKKYSTILKIEYQCVNLLDIEELRKLFTLFTPDYILHLASFSSVSYSWQHPTESFTNNTNIFLNLVTVMKEFNAGCRILSVGSSEEYGNVTAEDLPLKENQKLKPISPYAVARVSQEMLSRVFAESYHLNIIMTRSFNHMGPWQDERFVIPSFVKRIMDIRISGKKEGVIETGDTTIIRDFVDVRDVVRAYYLLLTKGSKGEIYNICSGKGVSLGQVISFIAEQVGVTVYTKVNPEFIRPKDNKIIVGTAYKIYNELGWEP